MHLYHLFDRGRMAGSDGPERFVPNRIGGRDDIVRYASGDLIGAHGQRLPGTALRLRFTNADNRKKSADPRGLGLGSHHGVGFPVMQAPL